MQIPRWSLVIALCAALILPGRLSAAAEGDGAQTAEAAVLQGFDLGWVLRPHRLNVLGLGVRAEGPRVWGEVRGGTWADGTMASDSADLQVHYAALVGSGRAVRTGSEAFSLEGRWSRRPGEALVVRASHEIEAPVPPGTEAAAVWLSGLRVAAGPEHPAGYTMQGLTVWAGPPRVDGDVARFSLTVSVVASAVPWRDQDLDAYTAAATVDWTLIPAEPAAIHREEPSAELRRHRRFAADPEPAQRTPLSWSPPEGTTAVLAGCSGFSFFQDGRGDLDGRFLRALTVMLDGEAWEQGRWSASAAARFSNAGALTRPMHTRQSTAWTALALTEGQVQRGVSGI